jgi:E3 ubiquitin-protein ligase UBR1
MQQMKAQQANFATMFGDEEAVSFGTCIVCQEDLNGAGGKLFGALGLIQPSRLIRRQTALERCVGTQISWQSREVRSASA